MLTHFQSFKTPISEYKIPDKFTFPFYYEPHPLCKLASAEVQNYLLNQNDFEHNFGLDKTKKGEVIGKMFGVLVVQNNQNEIGYIAAVSGKLADTNTHKLFVPTVYDMLAEESFFLTENKALKAIDAALKTAENNPDYHNLLAHFKVENKKGAIDIKEKKQALKVAKKDRDSRRAKAKNELSKEDFALFEEALNQESLAAKHFFNNVIRFWKFTLNPIQEKIAIHAQEIADLKEARKLKSNALQQHIAEQYHFLNAAKEIKNLAQVFDETSVQNIPAGAGECAAPKLLQYAFLNDLKPIAMAEFWWGKSPDKEVRKHKNFFPACQGKCKPILAHMLDGMELDINPLIQNPAIGKELEIVFEDEELIVIYKPEEFLSVPGIYIQDSVYSRIKQQIKNISGPIIVHRLDMSTSGLLVVAKNKFTHKFLQRQFIKRTVNKRYTALLDGIVEGEKGTINLPLRVDLDDRPRQLVCYEHGRPSITHWEVIERKNGKTKIHFYPVSGRTHQLRVHAAHSSGLNIPILGDDLYGQKSDRLYLHADTLEFIHPTTRESMTFYKKAGF